MNYRDEQSKRILAAFVFVTLVFLAAIIASQR